MIVILKLVHSLMVMHSQLCNIELLYLQRAPSNKETAKPFTMVPKNIHKELKVASITDYRTDRVHSEESKTKQEKQQSTLISKRRIRGILWVWKVRWVNKVLASGDI